MHFSPLRLRSPRASVRRPARFRASIEALDSRQLLAAGITATMEPVVGAAGSPVTNGPSSASSTTVNLLDLDSKTDALPLSGDSATINWGDGSPVATAQVQVREGIEVDDVTLSIAGPAHTYAAIGTYPITITVSLANEATPLVYTESAQVLATTVTATPIAITGNAGSPLRVVEQPDLIGGIDTASAAPLGTPIPLVSLSSSDMTSTLAAANYTGTIQWGDGSATDAAVFGTFNSSITSTSGRIDLTVNGPEHTYTTPGFYTITVSVTGSGLAAAPSVFTTTATISNTPTITGQLNPASDTGYSNDDGVTTDNTPNYFGTTQPGATVVLSASSSATDQTLVVGTGQADAAGNWSITTVPFVDGIYTISATSRNAAGTSATAFLSASNEFQGNYLIVDTAGPQITGFVVTNAKTGHFQVEFSDPGGVLLTSVEQSGAYSANRPSPTPKKGQTFPVAIATLAANYSFEISSPAVGVDGQVGTGKTLITKNGTYTFTIHAADIVGVSGATLDGEYTGKFPTGNGVAGGDFQVKVNVKNGKASGPIKITPAQVTTRAVHAKAVGKHHA